MGVVFGLLMLACALGSLPSGMAQLPTTPEAMLDTLGLCDQLFPESEVSIQDLTNSASVVLKGEVIAVGRYNCQEGSVEADIAPPAGEPENPDALVAVECEYTNQGATAALSTRSNEVIVTGFGPRADCLSPAPAAESGVPYFFFVEPYDEPSADGTLSQPEPALFCSGEEQPFPAFRLRYDAPSSAVVEAEPGDEALVEAEKRTVACAMATGEGAFSVSVSTSSPPGAGPQSSAATSESRAPGGAAAGQATASASPGGTTRTTTETTVTESGSSVTSVTSSSGGGAGSTTSSTSTSSSATNGLLAPADSVGSLTSGDSEPSDSLLTVQRDRRRSSGGLVRVGGGAGLGVGSVGTIGSSSSRSSIGTIGSSSLQSTGAGMTSGVLSTSTSTSTSTNTAAAADASPPADEEAASPQQQPAVASSRAASSSAADNDEEEASAARAPRASARGRAAAVSSPASNGADAELAAGPSPAAELRFPMAPGLELEDDSICGLPADPGPCEAYIPSWYFNDSEGRCRRFVYGGCLGNDNRFPSQAACMELCELF